MPIPLLLAGAGIAAGVLGVGGHLSAKETNERAESISRDAQRIYNEAKSSLESAQNVTEKALLELGYSKKNILDSSMSQFVKVYDKVQHVSVTQSVGLNELSNFSIDQQGVLQIQNMTDIYSGILSSSATGAAAGAVVALAASGELVLVTDVLGIAGSALAAGEIGAAAGIAGSALSFGAAMTPLGAIAAPVLLFTGISASMKADENLEKARTMYAEAEVKVEKMKISETLCAAIADRSDMFNGVLNDLNVLFSECTEKLEQLVRKKEKRLRRKNFTTGDFTENDLRLLAVTGSLAGAIKSVIDTPILSKDGTLATESMKTYDEVRLGLPSFEQEVAVVKTLEYDKMPQVDTRSTDNYESTRTVSSKACSANSSISGNRILYYACWVGGILFLISAFGMMISGELISTVIFFAIGFFLCPKTRSMVSNNSHSSSDDTLINQDPQQATQKSKIVAGLLAVFLGTLGVHKFYLGYKKEGFIMLAITIIGSIVVGIGPTIMMIVSIIEGIIYLTKKSNDFNQKYIEEHRGWF